ncbi:Beta-barrel assembly machine subunit BamB [Roseateles sp. YR242]|uniref:outer membrane protein assembly factor BamB n=1 Tax=Roseateles sp. YR242 TaxID=1855305 RepID=UPI0008C146F9|nr:outer membrane protein assembly factor BamB [Roseateles sp. YR242]SEL55899.1 Beta-barrel assembly machine subunit BamB [Roseateles sp. YR242]
MSIVRPLMPEVLGGTMRGALRQAVKTAVNAAANAAVVVAAMASVAVLGGCSLFSSSKDVKPAPLETFTPALNARVAWEARVDSVKFPLSVVAVNDQFVVAGTDGVVTALSAENGSALWRVDLGKGLSAGVGSDGRYAAAVTRDNELVVNEGTKVLWRKTLTIPVITAPFVAGERVFVLTLDRVVQAYDVLDGRKLWELRRPGEPLTLKQPGVIGAYQNTLVVAQGPRLAGVDPLRGTLQWEATISNPRGTNEVERLADLVGPMGRDNATFCARAFQSAVGCINADRGSAIWTRNVGGTQGVSSDATMTVAADGSDRISAWGTTSGDVIWTADQFQNRKLSAPLVTEKSVIFGDSEGYVHFLSRDKGQTIQRLATDSSGVAAAPVRLGNVVLIATRSGRLYALRQD